MRGDLLERLMRIVARTGERHVLVDASLPEPLVVLPLGTYEGLLERAAPPGLEPPPLTAAIPTPQSWEPEEQEPPAPQPQPTAEEPLNEEEKFYLEPID